MVTEKVLEALCPDCPVIINVSVHRKCCLSRCEKQTFRLQRKNRNFSLSNCDFITLVQHEGPRGKLMETQKCKMSITFPKAIQWVE